jgi:protein O-mannosyl-transferase
VAKKRARELKTPTGPALMVEPDEANSLANRVGPFIPLFILLAGVLAYANSLHAPFILDDRYHIVENTRIRQLWPPWDILTHSSRPVIHLSLALNYALGGLNPWGYHAFNIAVHILAALLLYGLVRRTFLSAPLRARWGAASQWLAGLTALIWLVHPLQTESVTYTIQRGESMMGLFYLLTIYCVARLDDGPRDLTWKAAAVAGCLLGIACKGGIMVTAPVMALLYDRAFLSSSWAELMRRRKGFYAALAATCLAYPILLAQAPAEWKESAGFEYGGTSPLLYAMTQPSVILHYLRLVLWPAPLSLDYGWQPVNGLAEALAPIIAILALLAASVWAWRKKPAFGFPGVWFFLILIPTSSFIPIADIAVEHRMYLSLAGVIVLAVAGMVLLGQPRQGKAPLQIPRWVWMVSGAVIAIMAAVTVARNSVYGSELAMWEDTVKSSSNNPRAQYDLGVSLEHGGQLQAAIAHYRTAIELNPKYVDALNNLGHTLSTVGKAGEGITYLQRALALKPDLPDGHNNLGYALAQQGQIREATPEFERALELRPEYAEAHNNLGIVLAMQNRTQDAMAHWQQALRLNPKLADAHNNLAFALSQSNRVPEALTHYEEALRIQPDYPQAQISLAKLLATATPAMGGNPTRAVTLAEQACQRSGYRVAGCLDALAISYAAANRFDDAARTAQTALQLAQSAGQADLAKAIESRLPSYRAHGR